MNKDKIATAQEKFVNTYKMRQLADNNYREADNGIGDWESCNELRKSAETDYKNAKDYLFSIV